MIHHLLLAAATFSVLTLVSAQESAAPAKDEHTKPTDAKPIPAAPAKDEHTKPTDAKPGKDTTHDAKSVSSSSHSSTIAAIAAAVDATNSN